MTDPTNLKLIYSVDGADQIAVERDHVYTTEQGALGFDLYRPPAAASPGPAVVFVSGLPDPGVVAMLGKPLKDWASYVGWARTVAASGIAAITYQNREPGDVVALIRHLRASAGALGIDPARIGVMAFSGNAPSALGVIARERLACAALVYPYLLDLGGATEVADAARQYYFALPAVTLDELPRDLPMVIVRAGRDTSPGLDSTLLRFVAAARERGLAVTVIEHAEGPHAFDLVDSSRRTREVIDEILGFLRRALG